MITTWAVNYKATVRAAFSVPITAVIPVYYKSGIPNLLCAGDGTICRSSGYITAEDLFQNEEGYNMEGGSVCFTKETDLMRDYRNVQNRSTLIYKIAIIAYLEQHFFF